MSQQSNYLKNEWFRNYNKSYNKSTIDLLIDHELLQSGQGNPLVCDLRTKPVGVDVAVIVHALYGGIAQQSADEGE